MYLCSQVMCPSVLSLLTRQGLQVHLQALPRITGLRDETAHEGLAPGRDSQSPAPLPHLFSEDRSTDSEGYQELKLCSFHVNMG